MSDPRRGGADELGQHSASATDRPVMRPGTLLGQTMGLVAVTAGLFAVGAYLGRNLALPVGLAVVHRRVRLPHRHERRRPAIPGLTVSPAVRVRPAHRRGDGANAQLLRPAPIPQAVWQAGAATALFIAGFGAAGYATRRDLSALARVLFWALIGLIVFGIVTHLRRDPQRCADLRHRWPGDLRRLDGLRLPAPARAQPGHPDRPVAGGLDLPRHPECVPAAAVALQRRARLDYKAFNRGPPHDPSAPARPSGSISIRGCSGW